MDSNMFLLLEEQIYYFHYPEAHWALSPLTSLSLILSKHRAFRCLQSFQFSIFFHHVASAAMQEKRSCKENSFMVSLIPETRTVCIKIRPMDQSKAQLLFSVWSKDSSLLACFGDRPFPVSEAYSIEDSTACQPHL